MILVTKSTSTENIGIGLARLGKKVLLIDADGQGSLTASLGFRNPDSMEVTLPTILERIIEDEEVNRNDRASERELWQRYPYI